MSKISISLSDDVLETAERECRREGESRSELVRRALTSLVERAREEARVATYLAGYIAEPESEDEVAQAGEAASALLRGSEWD